MEIEHLDESPQLRAEIDLHALEHNLKVIKQLKPQAKIIAIVKANAYGCGSEVISYVIEPYIDGVGVSRVHEGIALRKQGFQKKIVQLQGFSDINSLMLCIKYNLILVIHSVSQLSILQQSFAQIKDKKLEFWIKIESGMHRLGLYPKDAIEIYHQLVKLNIANNIVLCTHLSSAEADHDFSLKQYNSFMEVSNKLPHLEISVSASQSILFHRNFNDNYIRPGLMMYGIKAVANSLPIKPVMSLYARLLSIKKITAGSSVGYNNTWKATRDTIIGIVGIGYADGYSYPRKEINNTPMYINGRLVSIIGKISMDMTTVDLGPESKDKIGDKVEIFGANLHLEDLTGIDCSNYLLPTQLTSRVHRVYKNARPEQRAFIEKIAQLID